LSSRGEQHRSDDARSVEIRGSRLLLRALRPQEIDDEWQAMIDADPMTIVDIPDETGFRARYPRSVAAHWCLRGRYRSPRGRSWGRSASSTGTG